ncbi:alpha/beta hydrolase [bacterium]|nr:alpha/beta hydrolase [bacterium]
MHLLIRIATGLILIYVIYVCGLFLLQGDILFPIKQTKGIPNITHDIPGLEKIWLDTSFGKVEAWFLPPAIKHETMPAPAVIFAHGNAELIDYWPQTLGRFTSLGMGLLLVEYPGYGRSQGRPSQKSIEETFVSAYDTITAREGTDRSRIVIMGRSIGGGAACALAAKRPSAALILMSTFTSVRAFAPRFLIPGFIIRNPFDNLSVVTSYSCPVIIFHGKNDAIVPYNHGLALFHAAKQGKIITCSSGHNDCPPNWESFWKDLESFLRDAKIIR